MEKPSDLNADEDGIRAAIAKIPVTTQGLFLVCCEFAEKHRISAAEMAEALSDLQELYAGMAVAWKGGKDKLSRLYT
jgi:hypothetical protein